MATEKKEQRKEQYRLEILQSAAKVFARQGFHLTTMEAVAEECGWSKGTLYLYFKSKEDLFFSILIEKMDQYSASLHNDLKTSQGIEEKISAFIEAQFRFFTENKHFFQLVITEQGKVMHGSDSGLREKLINQQQAHIDQVSRVMEQGLPENTPFNAIILAGSIIGAINLHLVTWLMAGEAIDLDDIKRQIKTLFIHGILYNENN
ncbi:MAG: TetR/AcrR family transcriptional regulator [Candidatus Marinimicrobia bacterium]|nr:TetR/AcrR family transcriptional regulator [Candidatus Neomarinimicrobiota bacterium]